MKFESAILQKISVMKKNFFKTFVAILFFAFIIPCFSSCGDDLDGCGLTIVVIDGQSKERVPGASVHVGIQQGDITRDGITNSHGEIYFFFKHEAIFDVAASYGEGIDKKTGTIRIRLKEDQVISKEVPIY